MILLSKQNWRHIQRDRQADLVHSEVFLRAVLDASPLLVGARDAQGRYVMANQAVGRLYGVPVSEVEGSTDAELAAKAGMDASNVAEYAALDRQVMATGQAHVRETELANVEGLRRWFEVTKVPLASHDFGGMALSVATDITDRRDALQNLAASEERWFQLFEQSGDGIGYYTPDGVIVRFNQVAARRMGGIPSDFSGRTVLDLFPDSGEIYLERIRRAAKDQASTTHEDAVPVADGVLTFVSRFTPIVTGEDVSGVLVVSSDITERISASRALAQSERRLRTVYEALSAGVVVQDKSGAIIEANPAACEILGLAMDALIGLYSASERWHMADELGHEVDGSEHPAMVALATGTPVRDQIRAIYSNDSDEQRWLLINAEPLLDDQGVAQQVVTTFLDVTALREAQTLAFDSESRYRAILQSSPDGMAVVSLNGDLIEANPALRDMIGHDALQTEGLGSIYDYVHEEDMARLADDLVNLQRSGVQRDSRNNIVRQDGSTVPVESSASLLYGPDGEPVAAVAVVKDISQRLAAAERQRATMQMFNDLAEALPIGLFICQYEKDPERLWLLQPNPAATTMTGVDEERIGDAFDDLWPGARETGLTEMMLNVARTGETKVLPEFPFADESLAGIYRIHAFAVAGGRLAVAFDDVSEGARLAQERERMLVDLERSNALLEQAQSLGDLGTWWRSYATGQGDWSAIECRHWGYAEGEPLPSIQEIISRIHEDDRPLVARHLADARDGLDVTAVRFRIAQDNGEERHIETVARRMLDEQGDAVGLMGVSRDITDSVQSAQERDLMLADLASTNQLLERSQRMAGLGAWRRNPQTDVAEWSEPMYTFWGVDPAEPPPRTEDLVGMCVENDGERVIQHLTQSGQGVEAEPIRYRIHRRNDGALRHLETSARLASDVSGPVQDLVGVTRDITAEVLAAEERERFMAELLATNQQMESAELISNTGSWRTDVTNGEMTCSEELVRILGAPAGSQPTLDDFVRQVVPEDRPRVTADVDETQRDLKGFTSRLRFKRLNDGEIRHAHVEARLVSDPDRRPLWMIGVVRDITTETRAAQEREQMLQDLQEALQQIENAQRVAGIGLWRHDFDDLSTRPVWSDIEWRHWGREITDETPTLPELEAQMHPDDRPGMADFFRRIKSTKEPQPFQFRFYRQNDGGLRHMSAIAQAVADAEGTYRWIVGVTVDATEDVLAEQERDRFVASLQEANAQLEASQRLAGIGNWRRSLTDFAGEWSPMLKDIWGIAEDAPTPTYDEMVAMMHPEDQDGMAVFYQRAQASMQPERYEFRIYRRSDGELRHVVTEAQAQVDETGSVAGLFGVARDVTEQVASQAALRASEERYRLLAENASDVIWTADVYGRYTYVSPSVERLRGFKPREVLAQDVWEGMTPASRQAVFPLFEGIASGWTVDRLPGYPMTLEMELLSEGGSTVWTESVISPIVNDLGIVTGLLGVTRDISERRNVQQALRQSEEDHRQLVEHQTDLLIRVDRENRFQYVSRSYCELFGEREEDLLGQTYMPIVHPDDRRATATHVASILEPPHNASFEQRCMTAKGWRWLAWSDTAVLDEDGQVIGMVGAGRDVTERVEAERALADSESILRQVLDRDPAIIFAKDGQGRFQLVNETFRQAVGAQDVDILGITERQLARVTGTPDEMLDRWELEDAEVIKSQEATDLDEAYSPAQDGGRWYAMLKVPLNLAGDRHWVLGIGTDVTDRRRLEEQLRQAAKMEAVGRLAGGVAHDFNNLLTVINGYSAMLLSELERESPMRDEINEIHEAGERAASLTRQLLAFSRRQVQNERPVALNEVLRGMGKLLPRIIGEDIGLRWRLSDGLWPVMSDPGQIEQVVVNLAVNARDAMPNGGAILVETRNQVIAEEDAEHYTDLDAGDYVVLEVTDTGIGMSDEVQEHLFEPFYTTKDVGKGTGLGLAVVYGVVAQSQGVIHVYSELGVGTSFRIYMPRAHDRETQGASAELAAPLVDLWQGNETILLVEDEEPVRRLAQSALERKGYRVLVAESSAGAREVWATYRNEIDLLLTDVIMPGESGPEMARALAADRPGLPIMFVSGYSEEVLDERQLMSTGARLVRKPFAPNALARAVREMLDDVARRG